MTILQLFKIVPSRQFTLELLQLYGINDFVETHYFTKDDLDKLNIVQELNNIKYKLEKYYIPCKSKKYLTNLNEKKCITILRQFLKIHNHTLISKEKYVKGNKQLFYQVIPQQIDMLTKNRESEKVILSFD